MVIRPVILCGGAGTRLWPVSRQERPKQFLHLTGDQSLLEQTVERLSGSGFEPAIIVSGEDQKELIDQELPEGEAATEAILLEPVARNTAAAAALAAVWISARGNDELLLLMPSDHVIGDRDAFVRAIRTAAPHAASGAIVTFGATPTEPNTQYGYIEARAGAVLGQASEIACFHEKPDPAKAAEYLKSGRFFWNCGIFLAKASTLMGEMQRFLPESLEAIREAVAHAAIDGRFVTPSADRFSAAENISIDHGIMEKTVRGMVVPVQMQWSDIGAWDAVWKLGHKDEQGNVTHGDVVIIDSRNSLVRSDGRATIAAIGLENIAVISVDDAILVAPMDRVAEVKNVLATLKGRSEV